jgi:hypothetical protein
MGYGTRMDPFTAESLEESAGNLRFFPVGKYGKDGGVGLSIGSFVEVWARSLQAVRVSLKSTTMLTRHFPEFSEYR